MQTFSELPYGVRMHQLLAIKIGLRVYAKHGMKVNRDYTPKAMLRTAGWMTGKTYKNSRPDMAKAAEDLQKLADKMLAEEKARISAERILSDIRDSFGQVM